MTIRSGWTMRLAGATLIATGMFTLPFTATAQAPENKPRYSAEELAKAKPTATFDLTAEQYQLIIGGGTGNGTLLFQGKKYPFRVKGINVGGIGYTKAVAAGEVYFLKNVADFAGTYSAVGASGTLGAGAGVSQYENQKGVFVRVASKTEGANVSLGLGGITVELVK